MSDPGDTVTRREAAEFGELLRFTLAGYAGGLGVAGVLDGLGLARSGPGQWLVRTLAGEGESVLEGLFAVRKRLAGAVPTLAQAYGRGKLIGMVAPWGIDAASRALGLDVYGIETFYIPFFYAMSDQIGATVGGYLHFRRRSSATRAALRAMLTHPVMLAGLALILLVPAGLLAARVLGFSPTTQVRTALETICANLCWVPPLIGWLALRRRAGFADGPGRGGHDR